MPRCWQLKWAAEAGIRPQGKEVKLAGGKIMVDMLKSDAIESMI
jgi:hypothetical protein